MRVYSTPQLLILAALKKLIVDNGYTYARAVMKCTTLPDSTVYQTVDQFVEEGLLSAEPVTVSGRKRRHLTWTRKGLQELARLDEAVTKLEANLKSTP